MKNIISTIFILLIQLQIFAQNINFNFANPQPVIQEVYSGSLLSGDLDNDGDIDLVQTGIGENLSGQIAEPSVFLNDGNGNFILEEQNFNTFSGTEKIVLGDLDNDDDLDIIIAATNRTDLYRNDGQAQFVYDDIAPFQPSDSGELIIGDVDGDGDNDVLQYGQLNLWPPFAFLFLNDGSGSFVQAQNVSLVPFLLANIEFIDLEGDGDLDILSFGENENEEVQVGIYENDGSGNFSVFLNSNISPHLAEEISVGDIDNDGDEDVLVSGISNASAPKTILYTNNGNGQFDELQNTSFPDIFASSNAFADLDNDNDLDVVLIGSMAGGLPNIFSIIFENLGNNNFVAADSLGGEYIPANTIADFNGDGKKDIIIQGFVDDTNIYWNETIVSSIKENANTPFSVFPNPTNGKFQIEWGEDIFNLIELFDQQGKLLYSEVVYGQVSHHMEINLPKGLYVLKMSGEKTISTQKILLIE